jgi:branched-chain amino acid transport system substrate-binding protein
VTHRLSNRRLGRLLSKSVVIPLVGLLLAGCSSSGGSGSGASGGSSSGDNVIRFGLETSLSGSIADWGKGQLQTIQLWMKKVNAAGGLKVGTKSYKLSLKYYDNKSDVNQDASLTTRLITQDKVQFLFGPVSSLHAANSCAVNERYKVPSITSFAYVDSVYSRGLKYCYSAQAPVSGQYGGVVDLIKSENLSNIVVLVTSDELGDAFKTDFTNALGTVGLKPSRTVSFPAGTNDFSTVIAQVKSSNPDVIAVEDVAADSVLFRKQQVSFGLKAKISYFESGPIPNTGWEAAGAGGVGAVVQAAWTADSAGYSPQSTWSIWGSNQDFVKAFKDAYGSDPAWQDAVTAVACDVYAHAITSAGSLDGSEVRDAITATTGSDFYGPIKFDDRGFNVGPSASAVVQQYQGNGAYPVVWPQQQASAKLLYPDPNPH